MYVVQTRAGFWRVYRLDPGGGAMKTHGATWSETSTK